MPPEGGWLELSEVAHLSTLKVAVGTLNFVEKVMGGGLMDQSVFCQGIVTTVPGRCVTDVGFKGAGAGETLSNRSPVDALTRWFISVSHYWDLGSPRSLGLVGFVPFRFAMSPTQNSRCFLS